ANLQRMYSRWLDWFREFALDNSSLSNDTSEQEALARTQGIIAGDLSEQC
ncbi:MAG: hypothetical protein AWU59_2091, partial [Methanolobus sp. T82-4]